MILPYPGVPRGLPEIAPHPLSAKGNDRALMFSKKRPGAMLHRSLLALAFASMPLVAAEPPPAAVTTTRAVREAVSSTTTLTATVTARRQARLSARASGLIAAMNVDAGDVVQEGAVLMSLDAELAELALERVTAERTQALAELREAERMQGEAQALARGGSSSKSEAAMRESAVRSQTAAVQRFDAQVREQTALVARHRLVAPFAGVISRKLTEIGEWVQTGTPVVELVETGHLRVDVQAPQEMFARLTEGAEATVRLDAYPDREFPAKIATVVPVKDATARTFLVRLEIEDPHALASPGMSARATFRFRGKEQVWQVPRDAVVRFADGTSKVWTVEGEGEAAVARGRTVKLGATLSETIEVLDGLDRAAEIVVRGNEALREGQRVRRLPAEVVALPPTRAP